MRGLYQNTRTHLSPITSQAIPGGSGDIPSIEAGFRGRLPGGSISRSRES